MREKNNQLNVEYIPILKDFKDIFLVPPKRDIYFTIDLVPEEVPTSKAPYCMNILEFNKLKSQIQ